MLFSVCFKFIDGRVQTYCSGVDLKYWTIRDWYALYSAFNKLITRGEYCRIEINPLHTKVF